MLQYVDRPGDDITLIYNGVDTNFFNYKKINKAKAKQKYDAGFPTIACVSHFKFPHQLEITWFM